MSAWSRQVVKSATRGLLGLVLLSERSEAIEPESRLEGWVRLAAGQPAAGVQVRLFDLTDPRRSVGTTANEEGYFALAAPRLADARPQDFALLQNYPNPFNPSTIIPYQLSLPTHVRLEVFNVLGQHVATLVDREQPAGRHTATWHGTDAAGRAVAAGLYLYRIRGTGPSETRRMVLVDGPVSAPGAAFAAEPPTSLAAPEPTYGLTVSGRDVVTYIDSDFQADVGPVEIIVEARATSPTAMKVTTSDRIWGDVDANGQVDIFDALLVGLYSLDPSIAIPNDGDISLGDVNRDGHIDITDAYLIATYSVNPTDPSLPARIGTLAIRGKMYWVDASRNGAKIQRANIDGSQLEALVTTGLKEPTDLALDLDGSKMYWADRSTGKIQRANLDGSQIEEIVTGLGNIWSLVLDVVGGKMYWVEDSPEDKIRRANLDGSQVEDIVTTGLRALRSLALDVAGGKMYWADAVIGGAKILRANLDGSQVESVVISGLDRPRDLALDLAKGKMYWVEDSFENKIQRANLDGSQIEEIVSTGLDAPSSLALDLARGKIYWTDVVKDKILRANLDGSQIETLLATGLRVPRGLGLELADMPEVRVNRPPVLDDIRKQSVAEGELLRIDLFARDPEGGEVTYEAQSNAPGVVTVSVSSRQMTITPVELGVATVAVMASDASGATTTQIFTVNVTRPVPESQGKMYWTDWETDKIQRANLDGSQIEDLVTTGLDSPSSMALDVAGGKMYWIDAGTDKIQRANLDGSQIETLVATELDFPQALVLDLVGGKMYWTDEWDIRKIQRANLDGSQIETLVDDRSSPAGLALDLDRGKMYWTDTGRSRIVRSNFDGSQIETLVNRSLNIPQALALDLARGKMYWMDPGTIRIQRANLDGSQVEDLVVTGLDYPDGLALDLAGGKMYWTDWGTNKIQRANLDGTRIEDLVTGLSGPVGLALDIAVPDAPDLVVESPLANPPNPAPSQSFTLSVAIHNRGKAPAPPTTVRYYLSTDSAITTDDTEVGTGTVSELAAPSTTFKLIRLTAPLSPGTYYYGACVQPVSGESDIQNNCSLAEVVVVAQ